jgi:hypothetical protein
MDRSEMTEMGRSHGMVYLTTRPIDKLYPLSVNFFPPSPSINHSGKERT